MSTIKQKFQRGDLCRVREDAMGHVSWDATGKQTVHHHPHVGEELIVLASYAEQYGGDNRKSYTVLFTKTGSSMSWMEDHELELIRHVGESEIQRVIADREAREVHERDLAWIVVKWPAFAGKVPGASVEVLMGVVGITSPWGKNGEGYTWFRNAEFAVQALTPALESGDVEKVRALGAHVAAGDSEGYWRLRREITGKWEEPNDA